MPLVDEAVRTLWGKGSRMLQLNLFSDVGEHQKALFPSFR
uniref:Uncharacterized protein n=1 Tax=Anguilla anguilla TaxID=7936 RepID=A0A0E9S329_ANGAN